jgi:hypothetical protein
VASNLEQYIGRQIYTSYLNNAELRSGQHFRSVLNAFFDVREFCAILRRQTATNTNKQLARAYLADIASFEEIISNAASYHEVETRIDEIQELAED